MGKINMTGWIMKEHGIPDSHLTVIKENKEYKNNNNIKSAELYWDCQCDCGKIKTIAGSHIRRGDVKSCGCLRGNFINMTGWIMKDHGVPQSYLTVIEEDTDYKNNNNNNKKDNQTYWKCRCKCGKIITSAGTFIRNGDVTSCGCKRGDLKRAKLENERFGNLLVLNLDHVNNMRNCVWKCKCDCGNITFVDSHHLISGRTKSCGCKQTEKIVAYGKSKVRELTGQKFGKLTVIKYLYSSYHRIYLCQCECGNMCEVSMTSLVNGATQSCGCIGLSKGEYLIKTLLKDNNIPFETQRTYPDLLSPKNKQLRYDFYINNNFLLEYDGEQHYIATGGWSTNEKLETTQQHDEIKNEYAKSHNIPLKRIPYWDYDKITIESIMDDTYLII